MRNNIKSDFPSINNIIDYVYDIYGYINNRNINLIQDNYGIIGNECNNKIVNDCESTIYYVDLSSCPLMLGESVFYLSNDVDSNDVPSIKNNEYLRSTAKLVNDLTDKGMLMALDTVKPGGLLTSLLRMLFDANGIGINMYTLGFKVYGETDIFKILFNENQALIVQVLDDNKEFVENVFDRNKVKYFPFACPSDVCDVLYITHDTCDLMLNIETIRRTVNGFGRG